LKKLHACDVTRSLLTPVLSCLIVSEGYSGTLFHNEGLFIGLEGVVIVLSATALCIGHPGLAFDEGFGRVKVASRLSSKDGGESGMELVNR
jgi:hypothetical protein